VASYYLPFTPTFPYASELASRYGSKIITVWSHFDGVHYLTIAENGYVGTGLIQAFFPLYPLGLFFASIGGQLNLVVVGIGLSTIFLILAIFVLWKLMEAENESRSTIYYTTLLMLGFVTAYYFTSVYAESLFLLLSVSCFYLIEKKHWWWAGVIGGLAALTKVTGVFLFIPIIYTLWQEKGKFDAKMLLALLPIIGLGIYMIYLQIQFGDALLFAHVQSQFGASRNTSELVMLHQVFYRYAKMLITVPVFSQTYYQVLLELGATVFGIIGLILVFLKLEKRYFWYTLPAFLLPTLTGTFSSMPRYVLVLFPIFWALAKIKSLKIKWLIFIIFSLIQIVNIVLFTQGKWVS
jgi:Gpi18-like mannosyltransferase